MSKSKMSRKRFEQMSRDELLATKVDVEHQMSSLKIELVVAPADPEKLQRKKTLTWILRTVETELRKTKNPGKTHPETSPATQAEKFQQIAKELLEPGLYLHLLEQSREL